MAEMRLRSVRAKAGYTLDGLRNALTGLGMTGDPTYANRYAFCPLGPEEIEATYRGSGLMRKAIKTRALDTIRAGRDWQAEADQITAIEAEERRLGLKAKLYEAELLRALGGGAMILGIPGEPSAPAPTVAKSRLGFIQVMNRWQLQSRDWISDPTKEGYPGPEMWQVQTVQGVVDVHPSRVVCFRGHPLPNLIGADEETRFWGESRIEQMLGAVQNSDTAQQAFAALISKARSTIVGIPGLTDLVSTQDGERTVRARIATMLQLESMFNAIIRDAGDGTAGAGETIEHRQVNWTGIRDVMYAFATFVAAMADMPVTRLLGLAAEGMNASGDSQQKDYHKSIGADQDLFLSPCLDQIDVALIPSALGSRPKELWWKHAPLDTPSEAEESTRFKTTMEAVEKAQTTGAIPDRAFAEGFQNLVIENGWLPGIEGPLNDMGDDERYGLNPEPDLADPARLEAANENEAVEELERRGAINADQARALLTDARPRTLYVSRKLLNADEVISWAKGQGFTTTQPAEDMHVTICFSRQPVDWMKVGEAWNEDENGRMTVHAGGPRAVEPLGDKGAVVLLFGASSLSYRHEGIKRETGASFDYSEYQPHVTITYDVPPDLDLEKVRPYRGKLVFGPEIFEEVNEDWEKGLVEA